MASNQVDGTGSSAVGTTRSLRPRPNGLKRARTLGTVDATRALALDDVTNRRASKQSIHLPAQPNASDVTDAVAKATGDAARSRATSEQPRLPAAPVYGFVPRKRRLLRAASASAGLGFQTAREVFDNAGERAAAGDSAPAADAPLLSVLDAPILEVDEDRLDAPVTQQQHPNQDAQPLKKVSEDCQVPIPPPSSALSAPPEPSQEDAASARPADSAPASGVDDAVPPPPNDDAPAQPSKPSTPQTAAIEPVVPPAGSAQMLPPAMPHASAEGSSTLPVPPLSALPAPPATAEEEHELLLSGINFADDVDLSPVGRKVSKRPAGKMPAPEIDDAAAFDEDADAGAGEVDVDVDEDDEFGETDADFLGALGEVDLEAHASAVAAASHANVNASTPNPDTAAGAAAAPPADALARPVVVSKSEPVKRSPSGALRDEAETSDPPSQGHSTPGPALGPPQGTAFKLPSLTTAGGKAIAAPSAAALARARAMVDPPPRRRGDAESPGPTAGPADKGKGKARAFADDDYDDTDEQQQHESRFRTPFTGASGPGAGGPPIMTGFSLASGRKAAPISAQALQRARAQIEKDFDAVEQEVRAQQSQAQAPKIAAQSPAPAAQPQAGPSGAGSSRLSLGNIPPDTPLASRVAALQARSGSSSSAAPGAKSALPRLPNARAADATMAQPPKPAVARPAPAAPPTAAVFATPVKPAASTAIPRPSPAIMSGFRTVGNRVSTPQTAGKGAQTPAGAAPRSGLKRRFKTPFKDGSAAQIAQLQRQEALASTPRAGGPSSPARFATPARQISYGQQLSSQQVQRAQPAAAVVKARHYPPAQPRAASTQIKQERHDRDMFDLRPPAQARLGMEEYGIQPESISAVEAVQKGCAPEVMQILANPPLALDFEFLSGEDMNGPLLGPLEALRELFKAGAKHIDIRWVRNHWSLILWKLAALCRHVPEEASQRWAWAEVMRQFKYRYEREINRAHRSAIKRIQEHDSSPAQPMTLCVYGIDRSGDGEREVPPVILTDGWYAIEAKIDEKLFLAIVAGKIKVGQKLHISGARLDSSGEGSDVLEAFGKSKLVIHANGCALARWDARLGFTALPFFSTLRSLSGNGGQIPMMRIEVTRVYPMAYFDMLPPDQLGGRSALSTARNEAEELQAAAEWQRDREEWRHKFEQEWNARLRRSHLICELLQAAQRHAAGSKHAGEDEECDVDAILDSLESASDANMVLRKVPHLARKLNVLVHAAQQRQKEMQDDARAQLEEELDEKVPPRNVRSFRVIKLSDYFPPGIPAEAIRPTQRTAQMTIWDAAQLEDSEIKVGSRFVVTNLVPQSASAWRHPDEDAEVFLATRKDTRWVSLNN